MSGRRTFWGGRAPVRAMLYMAALMATRHDPCSNSLPAAHRREAGESGFGGHFPFASLRVSVTYSPSDPTVAPIPEAPR